MRPELAMDPRAAEVLGVSSSGFYAWRKRPPTQRAKAHARLAVEVRLAHKRGRGTYAMESVSDVLS